MKVEIKNLPAMHVAYVRHTGNYSKVGPAFEKLFRSAGPRALLEKPDAKVLAVYHDDPGITEESKLRTSVYVTIPEGMKTDGEVLPWKWPDIHAATLKSPTRNSAEPGTP